MNLQDLQAHLPDRTLDDVSERPFMSGYEVAFRARPGTYQGAVVLCVGVEDNTFEVVTSGTGSAVSFCEVADAYTRAVAFLRSTGLVSTLTEWESKKGSS